MRETAKLPKCSSTLSTSTDPWEQSLASSLAQMKPLPLFERLRDYQKLAVAFAFTQTGVALFCDPRTGKTWIALAIIEQEQPDNVLAVVPLTNKLSTWLRWITELLPNYTVCLTFEEFKAAKGKKRIFLIHYEALWVIIKKLLRVEWDLVIADESQRLKARASRQSRKLRQLRMAKRRVALSGTPMDDSEIDLWGQMRFVDHTILSDRWADFDSEFLKRDGFMGYGRKFRPEMSDEFDERISPHCLRVTREEAGIAEPVLHWCPVTLFGDQRSFYERLDARGVAMIGGATIRAKMEITKRVKLQQVTGGFVFDDDRGVHRTGEAKLRKLRSLLAKNIKVPAVIFCQYLPETKIIRRECREYSNKVAVLTGAVKDKGKNKRRTDMLESFQRGEIDYLVCQQRTGGVGVDMFVARNGIVYSHSHSWIDFEQMKSRMDIADAEPPILFLIYARDTIDEDKKDAVVYKRSLTEIILNKLKKGTNIMSKVKAKAAEPEKKKSNLPERPEYKYNVASLAEALGIEAASVRVALRKAKVAKAEGGVYGWNTKAEFDEVKAQLKAPKPAAEPAKPAKKVKKAA